LTEKAVDQLKSQFKQTSISVMCKLKSLNTGVGVNYLIPRLPSKMRCLAMSIMGLGSWIGAQKHVLHFKSIKAA
jgi:hypothetical protein